MCEQGKVQGARNTETGMYTLVHEDFEYRVTRQFIRTAIVTVFP